MKNQTNKLQSASKNSIGNEDSVAKKLTVDANLKLGQRRAICKGWNQAIEFANLDYEIKVPRQFVCLEITNADGKSETIAILDMSIMFNYLHGIPNRPTPDDEPEILIAVRHTGKEFISPSFLHAVGEIISDDIGLPVNVKYTDSNHDGSTIVKCADPDSAWNLAHHILSRKGHLGYVPNIFED